MVALGFFCEGVCVWYERFVVMRMRMRMRMGEMWKWRKLMHLLFSLFPLQRNVKDCFLDVNLFLFLGYGLKA